jgi:hypothetical protein
MAVTVEVAVNRTVLVTALVTSTVTGTVTETVRVIVTGTVAVTVTGTVVGIRTVTVDGTVTVVETESVVGIQTVTGKTVVMGTATVTVVDTVIETVVLHAALVGHSIPTGEPRNPSLVAIQKDWLTGRVPQVEGTDGFCHQSVSVQRDQWKGCCRIPIAESRREKPRRHLGCPDNSTALPRQATRRIVWTYSGRTRSWGLRFSFPSVLL